MTPHKTHSEIPMVRRAWMVLLVGAALTLTACDASEDGEGVTDAGVESNKAADASSEADAEATDTAEADTAEADTAEDTTSPPEDTSREADTATADVAEEDAAVLCILRDRGAIESAIVRRRAAPIEASMAQRSARLRRVTGEGESEARRWQTRRPSSWGHRDDFPCVRRVRGAVESALVRRRAAPIEASMARRSARLGRRRGERGAAPANATAEPAGPPIAGPS